jgi:hypothetical protein
LTVVEIAGRAARHSLGQTLDTVYRRHTRSREIVFDSSHAAAFTVVRSDVGSVADDRVVPNRLPSIRSAPQCKRLV